MVIREFAEYNGHILVIASFILLVVVSLYFTYNTLTEIDELKKEGITVKEYFKKYF